MLTVPTISLTFNKIFSNASRVKYNEAQEDGIAQMLLFVLL